MSARKAVKEGDVSRAIASGIEKRSGDKTRKARLCASKRTDGPAFVDGFTDDVHDTSQSRATDGDLAWEGAIGRVGFAFRLVFWHWGSGLAGTEQPGNNSRDAPESGFPC